MSPGSDHRLEEKQKALRDNLARLGSVVVAFSGGVDSTYLAHEAGRALGDRALAVTARSATYPAFQEKEAEALAERLGVAHRFIDSEELAIPGFRDNPPDRCYHCKRELFSKLKALAAAEGYAAVVDGSNVDDLDDFRPGMRALVELEVRSPLRDAGMTKDDIRELSRRAKLPTWDKPAFACLSSRFPYGTAITPEALDRVGRGEEELRRIGFRQYRVRHHGHMVRIEIAPEEMPKALDPAAAAHLASFFKGLGYRYVTLDLEGYRTGSMNEVLSEETLATGPTAERD